MRGYPREFLRRFYIVRRCPDGPEGLDVDDDKAAEYGLWWARRYEHQSFIDSACDNLTYVSSASSSPEEAPPPLSARAPTPDPRQPPPQSLTPQQRRYWQDSPEGTPLRRTPLLTTPPHLATVKEIPLGTDTNTVTMAAEQNTRLLNTAELEQMEMDDMQEDMARAQLGDGLSNISQERIDRLLSNLYEPSSPGPSGVKGEPIIPKDPTSQGARPKVPAAQPILQDFPGVSAAFPEAAREMSRTSNSTLSPEASPFIPNNIRHVNKTLRQFHGNPFALANPFARHVSHDQAGPSSGKRLNTTGVETLEARGADTIILDMLDDTVKEGDDALTGININDLLSLDTERLESQHSGALSPLRQHVSRRPHKRTRINGGPQNK